MAALAAHGLAGLDPAALAMVRSGDRHAGLARAGAAGLRAVGAARAAGWRTAAGAAFAVGIVLFCGGVYAVGLGGVRLGMVAPTGGTLLMLGWLLLGMSAVVTVRKA